MKTNPGLRLLLPAIVSLSLLLNACFNSMPKIKQTNPAFTKYISGYASGMISRRSTIRIELSNSVHTGKNFPSGLGNLSPAAADSMLTYMSMQLPDSTLLDGAFTFEPEIKGRAVWVTDRVIEFIPAEPLAPEQFYDAQFRLENVKPVEKEFETFDFQVSTYAQNVTVSVDGLRSYDDYNIEWQKLSGRISTSDYADTAAIRKVIRVTQNGKEIPVQLEASYTANEFYFYADSIERREKAGKVTVSWNGGPVQGRSAGSREIDVPALGDFLVTDAKVVDDGDQYIDLTFSDPILFNQDLKGIIGIAGVAGITYAIETNHVKVFLPNRLEGDKVLTVTTGVKNFKGYKMLNAYMQSLTFREPYPNVRIKGDGNILPN